MKWMRIFHEGKDKCLMKVKMIFDEKDGKGRGEIIIHEMEEDFNEGEYLR